MATELSLDDVSRVIRLVREVCDRWDDPAAAPTDAPAPAEAPPG